MRILVTGSSGFIGRPIIERLASGGHEIVRALRNTASSGPGEVVHIPGIDGTTDWSQALPGCGAVVHLAAQLPARGVPVDAFTETNELGTARLVEQALAADVRTFIYLSSIGAVTGHASAKPVDDSLSTVGPSAYGRSKRKAEAHVARFAADGRFGISLRPPILYGADAKGNWSLMVKLAASGLPLPFASVRNRRHLMAADNLVDAVCHLLSIAPAPQASGAYAIADREALGLADILGLIRAELGQPPRLWPVPPAMLASGLRMLGRGFMAESLFGDLEIDSSRFCETFNWQPPVPAAEAMRRAVAGLMK